MDELTVPASLPSQQQQQQQQTEFLHPNIIPSSDFEPISTQPIPTPISTANSDFENLPGSDLVPENVNKVEWIPDELPQPVVGKLALKSDEEEEEGVGCDDESDDQVSVTPTSSHGVQGEM